MPKRVIASPRNMTVPWYEPIERMTQLAKHHNIPVQTPMMGELSRVGAAVQNKEWWKDLMD